MTCSAVTNRESKLYLLLRLLCTRPTEAGDRLRNFIEGRLECLKPEQCLSSAIRIQFLTKLLDQEFHWNIQKTFEDTALLEIERHVRGLAWSLNGNGPFDPLHNADLSLARLCYALCRVLSPNTVIETGVAYGVTTSFMLQALVQNRRGTLWSIDLPPLSAMADRYNGFFVPQELTVGWQLQRGVTRRSLPGLLARIPVVDMFLHDSLHTRSNMTWEFETVWPYLRPGGVLISDDVQAHSAFQDFVAKTHPQFSAVVVEEGKEAAFGVAVKRL